MQEIEITGENLKIVADYSVVLSSVGNPDHGQNPARPLPGVRKRTAPAKTLEQASDACKAYIAGHLLGSGNWSDGQVFLDGKQVARVSYNGRVWRPE